MIESPAKKDYTEERKAGGFMKDEKYQKLEEYLQKSGKIEIRMTLSEIQNILGFPLDASAYKYREFWANCTASTKAYSWMDAG